MGRAKKFLGILATTLSVVALAACGSDDSAGDQAAAPGLRKVTYITGFGAAGRDAYAWMAREKGYFREAGLDVDIKLGAALSENLKALAAGQADFSTLDLTGGFIMAGQGKYTDFRAIAAVHQQTVVSIIAPADGPIKKPADLKGKTIGAATGSVNQALFPAYAKKAGLDPASVRWVNASPQQVPALLAAGRVDALSTFLIGRPGIEKAAGKPMTVLPYEEFLPDLYGNGIVTSTKLLESDPDLVQRFREAAIKGLADAIADPAAAAALLHKDYPAASAEAAEAEIKLMTPYTQPLGALDREKVTRAIKVLSDAGLFPAGLTADQVMAP
ncbi:ABC transporter substrate-binding protein [Actinoplanes sp. LDG1-06]|uniref:ABC transporter substrate-binding protein n=1 Tax=Paractinoplanes ovalisporus TaxID=2810368 RepID=A0ABS2A530_9ACTN|nr:ABC transporter substrate-binding protein [Actinoplanes ovalisporus]MBM2614953.1 ABC transporter substrate-binding protein [Actinoplanes ovalisporus]